MDPRTEEQDHASTMATTSAEMAVEGREREQRKRLQEDYEKRKKQIQHLCQAVKADSASDLQDILCSMVLSECVYKHGPYECLLNTVEACVINTFLDVLYYFATSAYRLNQRQPYHHGRFFCQALVNGKLILIFGRRQYLFCQIYLIKMIVLSELQLLKQ